MTREEIIDMWYDHQRGGLKYHKEKQDLDFNLNLEITNLQAKLDNLKRGEALLVSAATELKSKLASLRNSCITQNDLLVVLKSEMTRKNEYAIAYAIGYIVSNMDEPIEKAKQ